MDIHNNHILTEEDLIDDLKRIGVAEGDHLALGISFRSLGKVEGGPKAFLSAIIKVLGPSGTVMIPAYTRFFPLKMINNSDVGYIFDYKTTPATTGVVPETLRIMKGTKRSKHPTNSIVAYGKMSDFFTQGHDENALAYSPYSLLAKVGGKVLCVGIGGRIVGFRHEAQYLAGLLDIVPFEVGVRYRDESGNEKIFVRKDKGGCVKKFPELNNDLKKEEIVKKGKIGKASSVLLPARESLEIMTRILKEHPERNLCDDISCIWCREIERRLNLYDKIENPRYFQKYRLITYFIASVNYFRLNPPKFFFKLRDLKNSIKR